MIIDERQVVGSKRNVPVDERDKDGVDNLRLSWENVTIGNDSGSSVVRDVDQRSI